MMRPVGNAPADRSAGYVANLEALTLAYQQGAAAQYTGDRTGRCAPAIAEVQRAIGVELAAIHPDLEYDALMSAEYRSNQTTNLLNLLYERDPMSKQQIEALRRRRTGELLRLGYTSLPCLEEQTIAPGQLSTPPYATSSSDTTSWTEKGRGCSIHCFRMIVAGLTGWTPDFWDTRDLNTEYYGAGAPHSDAYLKTFETPAFQELAGQQVRTRRIFGADFSDIRTLATKARTARPDCSVYAITQIGGSTLHKGVIGTTHQVVLLRVSGDVVTCHDPSGAEMVSSRDSTLPPGYEDVPYRSEIRPGEIIGAANRRLSKAHFAMRWALGLNEALLVMGLPAK